MNYKTADSQITQQCRTESKGMELNRTKYNQLEIIGFCSTAQLILLAVLFAKMSGDDVEDDEECYGQHDAAKDMLFGREGHPANNCGVGGQCKEEDRYISFFRNSSDCLHALAYWL